MWFKHYLNTELKKERTKKLLVLYLEFFMTYETRQNTYNLKSKQPNRSSYLQEKAKTQALLPLMKTDNVDSKNGAHTSQCEKQLRKWDVLWANP